MKNSTYLLLALLCICCSTMLEAQINVLKSEEHVIEATINLVNDQVSDITSNTTATIQLQNGELAILFPANRNADQQFYKVNLEISLDGQSLTLMEENLSGFLGEKMISISDDLKTIKWLRLVDNYKQLDGRLRVKINTELKGKLESPIDCSTPPTFTKKQKLPYLIAGGAGLAAIGVGQVFKNKSDKTYEDDYLTSQSLSEAQPKFESANNDHHTYLILTYAGSAIVVADVVWYLIRNGKHKKRLELYEKFCNGNSLSVRPLIEIPTGPSGNSATGVTFTLNF